MISEERIKEQYAWEYVLAAENEQPQSQAQIIMGEAWCMQTIPCTTNLLPFCYSTQSMFINNLQFFFNFFLNCLC